MECAVSHYSGAVRPPIHVLNSEHDVIVRLALQVEHRQPVLAMQLFEELDRATLHESDAFPPDAVRLGSLVDFVDERSGRRQLVEIVLPGEANIAAGKVSILTPIGVALLGLRAKSEIDWPDLNGQSRRLRVVTVIQPNRIH